MNARGRRRRRDCLEWLQLCQRYCGRMISVPIQLALLSSLTCVVVVIGAALTIDWGFVHIGFAPPQGGPRRALDLTIGLLELQLTMHTQGRVIRHEPKSFHEQGGTLGHLPVIRHYAAFEQAGWVTLILMGISQVLAVVMYYFVLQRLCYPVYTRTAATPWPLLIGLAQGVVVLLAMAAWALLVPLVGIGTGHKMRYLWGFYLTTGMAAFHTITAAGAVWLAYREFKADHHFSKLPGEEPEEGGPTGAETELEVVMEKTPWGNREVQPDDPTAMVVPEDAYE